jgi:hypothetical protein
MAARIAPGRSVTVSWRVTPPAGTLPPASMLTATARYTQAGRPAGAADSRTVRSLPPPPTADTPVSAMPFLMVSNGWGPVERNISNGENGSGDGKPITVATVGYTSGLGVHAPSDVGLYLQGHCTRLTAVVGLDDEVGNAGSVVFSVVVDGRTVYTSPVLTGASAALPIDVALTGGDIVELLVADAGDGNGLDHADWADARLACGP